MLRRLCTPVLLWTLSATSSTGNPDIRNSFGSPMSLEGIWRGATLEACSKSKEGGILVVERLIAVDSTPITLAGITPEDG